MSVTTNGSTPNGGNESELDHFGLTLEEGYETALDVYKRGRR